MKNNTKTNVKENKTQSDELHKKVFEVQEQLKSIDLDLNKIDSDYQNDVDRLDRKCLDLNSRQKKLVKLIKDWIMKSSSLYIMSASISFIIIAIVISILGAKKNGRDNKRCCYKN